uniref:Uncharacterized protein n=1 Tax=Marmota marmota marmota TaxID=9994 RepID=A0A8C6EV16_MARMA
MLKALLIFWGAPAPRQIFSTECWCCYSRGRPLCLASWVGSVILLQKLHPSLPNPLFAEPVVSLTCLALCETRSSPSLSVIPGYFYPQLEPRCFLGDPGDATPNALSSDCAPRSNFLLPSVAQRQTKLSSCTAPGLDCSSRHWSSREGRESVLS